MKKKHPEHVNLERWLVSYADFITLLFAFFVIMYAMSKSDAAKFKQVSSSMKAAFSSSPVGMIDIGGGSGGNTVNPFEVIEPSGGRVHNLPAGKTNTAADPDPGLQEVRELLEESMSLDLGVTDVSDRIKLEYDSRGLVVRIAAKDFFAEGDIDVRPDFRPILDQVGRVLSKTNRLIRIEGHSDRHETKIKRFSSDWELSAARAAWVVRYWIARFEFDPSRLGVSGYSHFRPLTDKDDELSRSRNRRIEIILLNNQYSN